MLATMSSKLSLKIHPGVLEQILSILNLCLLNLKETVCMVFVASGKTNLEVEPKLNEKIIPIINENKFSVIGLKIQNTHR